MMPAVNRGDAVAVSAGGDPPGVVHEYVEPAVTRDDLFEQRVDCIGLAHIGREEQPTRSGRSSGSCGSRPRRRAPALAKRCRDPAPDAAAAAGDEHDLIIEAQLVDWCIHWLGILTFTARRDLRP